MRDLHELPKLRDSLSYVYVEHAVLNQKAQAIESLNQEGRTMIPVANLSVLMLGPGTSISHAAVKTLAQNGCTVLWLGEDATRFYAQGTGETRKAYQLLRQAELASDPRKRLEVVMRMYRLRFDDEELDPGLTLQQIRGKEGARVRETYARASRLYGIKWQGRRYERDNWGGGDPVNRALSAANALLNGLCHAAIVSGGYSPAIGFIHTGKQLSFVYDIADLYKADFTIPMAFKAAVHATAKVEAKVRELCRQKFREEKLLQRILPDIERLLDIPNNLPAGAGDVDADGALPEEWWDPPQE
jgi:CRISP-associated protein Cas1